MKKLLIAAAIGIAGMFGTSTMAPATAAEIVLKAGHS